MLSLDDVGCSEKEGWLELFVDMLEAFERQVSVPGNSNDGKLPLGMMNEKGIGKEGPYICSLRKKGVEVHQPVRQICGLKRPFHFCPVGFP